MGKTADLHPCKDGKHMKYEPIQRISARWDSPLPPEEVLTAVSVAFDAEKVTVDALAGTVEVRSGSNFKYRMLGESLNGYKNFPVALNLKVQDADTGSTVDVSAFDTFGFRLTDRLFHGADTTLKPKLVDLLEVTSTAVKPRNPGWS